MNEQDNKSIIASIENLKEIKKELLEEIGELKDEILKIKQALEYLGFPWEI